MFLMLAEVFRTCDVFGALPGSAVWGAICFEQTHAAWVGGSLHDLIQPSFYFIVGIAVLFSIARRAQFGQRLGSLYRHTAVRAVVLVVLGVVLMSVHPRRIVWMFTDTLAQIGLAFPFVVLIAVRPKRDWWIALTGILAAYWLWFALYPVPTPDFNYSSVGVPPDWLQLHGLSGFAAHWQKNTNVACAFDRWLLNIFPRSTPYVGDITGLATLNFIPSIGTMILGLFAGHTLLSAATPTAKLRWFTVIGIMLMAVGWSLGLLSWCPVVKAIWTPSWVLFSGGWCFLFLAAFYALADVAGYHRVFFPLMVIGMNSIVAYGLSHLFPALAFNAFRRVVGSGPFRVLGTAYEPMLYGCAVFSMYWLILYALYRQRIFIRI